MDAPTANCRVVGKRGKESGMNYFQRSSDTVETEAIDREAVEPGVLGPEAVDHGAVDPGVLGPWAADPEATEPGYEESGYGSPARNGFAGFGDRIARAFASLDRGRGAPPELVGGPPVLPADDADYEEYDVPSASASAPAPSPEDSSRFPVAPFGYNRGAVDGYVAELERELQGLRAEHEPAISITEEIERLGEQTASILVVAHDQAHETTRLAQEQADRCIADAASNAVAMTEQAKQRLRELDGETDAVWQERRRLIEDVRTTATALFALAEDAIDRFPEEIGKTVESDSLVAGE
jgi:hypothetical protein